MNAKRRRRLRSVLNSVDQTRKDDDDDDDDEGEKAGAGDTSQGEWGTDFDTEPSSAAASPSGSPSGSASEVEDQVRDDTDTKEEMDGDTEQRVREKI